MNHKFNNLPILKERRKALRNNATEAERILWCMLKDSKLLGRKFRRQHSIGYYIADFYCPSGKIVIELDGKQHSTTEGLAKDKQRDEYLAFLDIKVLRFKNEEIKNNLTGVLKVIKGAFRS